MMKKILLPIVLMLSAQIALADTTPRQGDAEQISSVEHVLWDKIPISFVVPVGQERILMFSDSVKFEGSKAKNLTKDLVSVLNNEGTLYVKANKAFAKIRVPVVLTSTGETILIDLSAKENADDIPVQVLVKKHQRNGEGSSENSVASEMHTFPTLIRYVGQRTCSECGPISAEEPLDNIVRAPMNTSRFVRLFNHRYNVTSMPIGSWRSGQYYATAVRVKNLSNRSIKLNPINIKGDWRAASFLPTNTLKPAGQFEDRATIILVSERPFGSALSQTRGYFHE